MGGSGRTTEGTTLLDGLRASAGTTVAFDPEARFPDHERCDVGIVCIAEPPYAEGPGDRAEPAPTPADHALFDRMQRRAAKVVLVVFSGRPLVMPELIERADAVVAAWLPGSEGAALADLLTGRARFEGRTTQPWPRSATDLSNPDAPPLLSVGHGLAAGAGGHAATQKEHDR